MAELRDQELPFLEKATTQIPEYSKVEKEDFDELNGDRKRNRRKFPSAQFLIIIILLISNSYFLTKWSLATSDPCIRPKLTYSPAKSVIQYEKKTLWRDIQNNRFTGLPREELDQAWHNLLSPLVIRISNEELKALDTSSLALVDGSGFIAETAAYHELHCIKRIRRHLHMDYYYGNMTEDEVIRETKHVDHCLEYWREAAMCRGDTTLSTFHWDEITGKPFSSQESTHECINWERFAAWAEERKVDTSDYSILTGEVVWPV